MLESIFHFLVSGPGKDCVLAIPALAVAAIIGALVGAAKNSAKEAQAAKQRKYEAETARWSPWTGMQGHYVQDPSLVDEVSKGVGTGLSFGMSNAGMFGGGSAATGPAGSNASDYTGLRDVGSNMQDYKNLGLGSTNAVAQPFGQVGQSSWMGLTGTRKYPGMQS